MGFEYFYFDVIRLSTEVTINICVHISNAFCYNMYPIDHTRLYTLKRMTAYIQLFINAYTVLAKSDFLLKFQSKQLHKP